MKYGRLLALPLIVLLTAGCGGPRAGTLVSGPRVTGQPITVREFTTQGAVIRYEGVETFGLVLAEEIASELRRRGYQAEAIPASATARSSVVVSGRLTRVDGGSRALRYFVSFGAGAAKFGAAGEVSAQSGGRLGSFSDERRCGWGIFGGSSQSLLQKCVREVSEDVANMIDRGEYRGGASVPAAPVSPASATNRSATDRLRELDALRQQGALTDEEYQQKRRRILDEL